MHLARKTSQKPLASLRKQGDFKRVYSRGKSAAGALLVVYAAANDLGINRLGLSVSKNVGNAEVHNRVRRLIKESCRILFSEKSGQAEAGLDLIVIARVSAGQLPHEGSFAKVNGSLVQLFGRLGVLT
jgi:ribonuclease P protein component